MRMALALARRAVGNAWPNPPVGCVVAGDGAVVGRGWTRPGGRPHAETEALRRAGLRARGATIYVSLEPCAHRGETPPCVDAIVDAGVARAVVAMVDPDPRVDGGGIAALRAAGIAVDVGVGGDAAAEVAAGFLMRLASGRPLVTLKLATSLDGRIAAASGESRWITGARARAFGHGLRARHDAILIGAGTALQDDPRLDCRLPGLAAASPVRVVVCGRRALPPGLRLFADTALQPTWLISAAPEAAGVALDGVEVLRVDGDDRGRADLAAGLRALAACGVTSVLVEGGSAIAAELLALGLVDRLVWFRAPRLIGADGLPAAAAFGVSSLDRTADFKKISTRAVGRDIMEVYARAADGAG